MRKSLFFIFIYFISFSFVFNSDHYFCQQECRWQQPRRGGQQRAITEEERTAAEEDETAAEAAEQEKATMRIEADGGCGAAI